MGRGLSELQKTILVTALNESGGSLLSEEDAKLLWSLGVGAKVGERRGCDIEHATIHRKHYGQLPRTNTTRSAISRAMQRLADRGLITRLSLGFGGYRAGGDLTPKGTTEAKRLLVNKRASFPSC